MRITIQIILSSRTSFCLDRHLARGPKRFLSHSRPYNVAPGEFVAFPVINLPQRICNNLDSMDSAPGLLTLLLHRMKAGDRNAESELFEQLYSDLRRIARRLLSAERPNQTLTPTGLVHCAYLRLREIDPEAFQDHHHFLRVAAKVMRQLLVDQARAYKAAKRSGALQRIAMRDSLFTSESDADKSSVSVSLWSG